MFPHIITIFHHETINGTDSYTRYVVPDVFWYGSTGISADGKGLVTANAVTVITSAQTAHSYKKTWNVQKNDRIVKGECPAIESFKDLNGKEVITVTDVSENIVNSDVDNITITGK